MPQIKDKSSLIIMDNIPEFDDAESLFVNWKDDDNSGCSNNAVAGAAGGPSSLSKETGHLSSNDWNDILDAADRQPSNGASSAEDSSGKTRSNKVDNKVSASSSENTTSSATANTAITSDVKSKSNDNGGNSSSGNSLQFSIDGGDETTTNFGDSSLSSNNNNNFTFPMYYQMNQGHIHPLAMTSMASCPPYNVNAASEAPQNATTATTVESANLQSLMQQQQQAVIQSADQQMQTHINNSTSATTTNSSGGGNNATTTLYNSPYADHLRELTANFRNNPSTTTSMNASQAHYGMAVNGFHPQVNAQVNHVLPLSGNYGGMIGNSGVAVTLPTSSATSATTTNQAAKTLTAAESSGTIKTSNKRSNGGVSSGRKRNASATTVTMNAATDQHTRNSRERNEREQVRAQKITQLISELRVNMQQGGWQEEMKSKYQTLSQCKEYVDFLVRSNKEKLADIEHTKKLVKEKFFLEARSGHLSDSVTSSLTAFTTPSSDSSEGKSSTSSDFHEQKDRKKRKKNKEETEKGGGTAAAATTTDSKEKIHDGNHVQSSKKEERRSSRLRKRKLEEAQQEQQQQVTTKTDSSSDYDDDESPGGKNIAFDKTSSSVSDMTDSNKSCTTNNNTKGSTGSISSTAAVVRGLGSSQNTPSRRRHRQPSSSLRNGREEDGKSDAVQDKNEDAEAAATGAVVNNTDTGAEPSPKKKKKKKRSFGYDFREVFLKSNVPQLIATLSGRIVVWNDFFLRATGLNKQDIGRLTIFSIVQSNQLSALYKMVARALAEQHVTANSSEPSESTPASESESPPVAKDSKTEDAISQKQNSKEVEDWQVITLRCVPFPSSKNEEKERPLFLTITLMGDANLDQRCFHCTLTDAPSNEGQVGTVTPEFLVKMFSPPITAGAGKGT